VCRRYPAEIGGQQPVPKIRRVETEAAVDAEVRPKKAYRSLFAQILVAVVAGVAVGHFWSSLGADLKPIGDGFVKLIKMVIAPLIFCVVVTGIAKVGDLRAVGRIGVKALVYFEVVSTAALAFGLLMGNLLRPGAGMNVDPSTLDASAVDAKTQGGKLPGFAQFLLDVIPSSIVDALARNALLQVLLFAVLFGCALAQLGEKVDLVVTLIDKVNLVIFRILGYVMKLAPLGAFGAMAFLVGQYGLASLRTYFWLILACYAAALLFCALLGVIAKVFAGVNIVSFLRYAKEEFLLALGTASSEAVLPRMVTKLQQAGCAPATVGLVLPTGYSFNLDGASIYLSLATVFLAQALNIPLSLGDQSTIVLVLVLTSKGMAGVPGSAFLALSATVAAVGSIPAAAVALLLGADRIMDSMRVFTNLLGNCVATFVVSRWEGLLDQEQMRRTLERTVTE
jgi:aerobic C4-dicarboxylate transport protein